MTTNTEWTTEATGAGQYADVNGINLYYEIHGTGRPLVLLHGGLGSGEMFGPALTALAEGRQVILPDLQGHGRTADIDRPIDARLMADDIAALIQQLGLEKPDVVGYSLGGGVAFWTAFDHPELVGKLVMVSTNLKRTAIYAEMLGQQGQVSAAAAEFMKDTPMYQLYQRVAPRPEDFGRLLDKMGASMAKDFDHSEEFRGDCRCRPSSPAPMPTCSRRATRSRRSGCSVAASATAAGWPKADRRAGTRSRSCRARRTTTSSSPRCWCRPCSRSSTLRAGRFRPLSLGTTGARHGRRRSRCRLRSCS